MVCAVLWDVTYLPVICASSLLASTAHVLWLLHVFAYRPRNRRARMFFLYMCKMSPLQYNHNDGASIIWGIIDSVHVFRLSSGKLSGGVLLEASSTAE